MAFQNYWKDSGLHRVFTDEINGEEILSSNLSIHGDARFDDIHYVLNDFTAIQTFVITDDDDVATIAAIDDVASLSKPVLKIAIVTTLEALLEWVHMYLEKMKNSPFDCQVFDTVEDARLWVNCNSTTMG